jgi:hypothetical protein
VRRALHDRRPGGRLDGEAEAAGEPDGAERAQAILAQARRRIAHRPHDAPGQISEAVERIVEHASRGAEGDGVDGEVAPREVVVQRRAELHLGVAPVGAHVATEGRHLVHHAVAVEHADRAELDALRHRAAEEAAHDVRRRRRGQVPVERRVPQHRVAHRAAHAPRLVPRGLEPLGDLAHAGRRPEADVHVVGQRVHRRAHASNSARSASPRTSAPSASISSMRACGGRRTPAKIAPRSCSFRPPPG